MTKSAPTLVASLDRAEQADRPIPRLGDILVDIDTSARSQPVLDLAWTLARSSGARLRAVDASSQVEAGAFAEPKRPHDLLIEEVERFGPALLLRDRNRADRDRVNHRLFRHCPCPVWAVAARPRLRDLRILVAVDPVSPDPVAHPLDAGALRLALSLRALLHGTLTVFHAWTQPAEKKLRRDPAEVRSCLRATESHAAGRLLYFLRSFGPAAADCRVALRHGAVEETIPAFVVSEGIDLVIAGAPTGLFHRLFGNTAERLLDAAPCSVIAFKQPAPPDRGRAA